MDETKRTGSAIAPNEVINVNTLKETWLGHKSQWNAGIVIVNLCVAAVLTVTSPRLLGEDWLI